MRPLAKLNERIVKVREIVEIKRTAVLEDDHTIKLEEKAIEIAEWWDLAEPTIHAVIRLFE